MAKDRPLDIVIAQLIKELTNPADSKRNSSQQKLRISLKKIIMDSVSQTNKSAKNRWASIHLNRSHYSSSRYQNSNITYRIHVERAYKGMLKLGYLRQVKAGLNTPRVKYLTRYEATEKLVSLFQVNQLGVLEVEKSIIENEELIRLRIEVNGERKLVDYAETTNTLLMRDNLSFINSILTQQWIDLELTDAEFIKLEDDIHQRSLERREGEGRLRLQDRRLYRVFNSSNFDAGGRFYGGWWQIIPSIYRQRILINGKRTEELDFANLHPTILYAQKTLPLIEDAYSVSLKPQNIPENSHPSHFRKVIKSAFNAMLNANHEILNSPRDLKLSDWGVSWNQLVDAILKKHRPIASEFFKGTGLKLQYVDSQIAEELMMTFAKENGLVPLLPVHDSFICHHGYKKDVKELMTNIFKRRYGVRIVIKESEKNIEHLYGVCEAGLDELLSYKDTSFEKRLDYFRENNPS
jgi:hypothetical protein